MRSNKVKNKYKTVYHIKYDVLNDLRKNCSILQV